MTAFDFADRDILVTTSHDLPGRTVEEYLGVVIADVTPGRHLGKDFLAGIRNIFGGRSKSWEHTLKDNQEQALRELVSRADELGADAVIALEMEDEALSAGGMMNIKAIGTAVSLAEE